ncbi:GNAT family N-acetyltransferase, partial [Yersinia pestis]
GYSTVQLVRATKANALHRAEIEKLMVHPKARQQGIAFTLLELVEQYAKQIGLSLLVLDTRTGDVSEQLYRKFGFEYAGLIQNLL